MSDTQTTDPWAGYTPYRYAADAPAVEEERMPLFYIGDTEYTAPKRVSVSAALRCLEKAATNGVAAGTYAVLLEALGAETFQVLTDAKQVPYEEAQDMITRLSRLYFGQAMELAGK